MSRRHFLKGLGGSAVAFGMLSGIGNFASTASARSLSQDRAMEALKPTETTDLTGEELLDVTREVAQRRDIVNLMGLTWSAGVRKGRAAALIVLTLAVRVVQLVA